MRQNSPGFYRFAAIAPLISIFPTVAGEEMMYIQLAHRDQMISAVHTNDEQFKRTRRTLPVALQEHIM
jgi:hypothetical protein